MATIADKLQIVADQKTAIKNALENKGKAPTEQLSTYAGLINELENEEQISYVLTNADGTQRAYAVKSAEEAITLTATENDIRQNTTAITDKGYTEGQKDIPAYHTEVGTKAILAGKPAQITIKVYDYTKIHVSIANFNVSMAESVEVTAISVENAMYEAGTTTKLADITKDDSTETINLGITAEKNSVLRYFIMREE